MAHTSVYRITRNIEVSISDWLEEKLAENSWDCNVSFDFSGAYEVKLPVLIINADDNPDKKLEVGSNQLCNFFILEFRVFATSEAQRKDLRDFLRDNLMSGIPYYAYVIDNDTGEVQSKTLSGRINIGEIISNRKELRNTDATDVRDRYRHLLSVKARISLS